MDMKDRKEHWESDDKMGEELVSWENLVKLIVISVMYV